VATVTTAADGTWAQSMSFEENSLVRAVYAGSPAAVADWAQISVAPVITLSLQSTSPLVVTGTVTPAKQHVTLELYRGAAARGRPVSHKRTTAAAGTFRGTLRVPGPGSYVVLARTVAGRLNAAGVSAPVAVTTG
jgi:hypothetical protein